MFRQLACEMSSHPGSTSGRSYVAGVKLTVISCAPDCLILTLIRRVVAPGIDQRRCMSCLASPLAGRKTALAHK